MMPGASAFNGSPLALSEFNLVEIQPDDVPELLFKALVVRQFEGAREMRLDVTGRPQALHAGRRDPAAARAIVRLLHRPRSGGGITACSTTCCTAVCGSRGLLPRPARSVNP